MPGWGGGKSRRCRNLHNPSPKTPPKSKANYLKSDNQITYSDLLLKYNINQSDSQDLKSAFDNNDWVLIDESERQLKDLVTLSQNKAKFKGFKSNLC